MNFKLKSSFFTGNISNALKYDDGLAVLGFFYNFTCDETSNPWVDLVGKVIEPLNTYSEKENLFSIFNVVKQTQFYVYTYPGSLTTPNCNPIVTWMVSTGPTIPINFIDLNALRRIHDEFGEPIKKNFRPPQPLNGRRVVMTTPLSY